MEEEAVSRRRVSFFDLFMPRRRRGLGLGGLGGSLEARWKSLEVRWRTELEGALEAMEVMEVIRTSVYEIARSRDWSESQGSQGSHRTPGSESGFRVWICGLRDGV